MRLIPLLLILSACTVAGPGFRGIDPVPRSLGGNDFLIRQKGTVAEVIRTDRKMLPRFVPMAEAMVALVLADHALRHEAQCGGP